jgi:hypothetical protein
VQGNNYLKAEGIWRNLHADSLTYGTNGSDHYGSESNNEQDSIGGYMWFAYRDYPFPQWMFDQCDEEERRLRAPETLHNVRLLSSNEVEVLMPDDFLSKDYLVRFYSTDGRELSSRVMRFQAGQNIIYLGSYQGLTVLNLLSPNGDESLSIIIPIRQ